MKGLIIKDLLLIKNTWKSLLITFMGSLLISIATHYYLLVIITIPNTINTFISLILINLYIFINNINIGKTITDKAYKTVFINGLTTILTLTILNIIIIM